MRRITHLNGSALFAIPLNPSHILKVTEFLGKIAKFKFLVITERKTCLFIKLFVIKYFRF